jgi:hypothetical protein
MGGVKNLADTRLPKRSQTPPRGQLPGGTTGLLDSVRVGLDGTISARLTESLALLDIVRELLADLGQASLSKLILGAHRSDPRKGVRGSQLTIVTSQHAAAAKLQLLSPSLLQACQSRSLGFQAIAVRSQRMVAPIARPTAGGRPSVPGAARERLLTAAGLIQAQDH